MKTQNVNRRLRNAYRELIAAQDAVGVNHGSDFDAMVLCDAMTARIAYVRDIAEGRLAVLFIATACGAPGLL